ncbi:hypothetical protein [Halobacterium wangiae]|uniref:hypothetical protein n=1 Tax=Halobacterium wangiae TaxID=2902623 RepID=UPI001E3F67B0|nr:hypothetical protein [Halobacterium wangiae]
MSDWSPASIPSHWLGLIVLLYVLLLGYSVLVIHQPLLVIWFGMLFVSLYLLWRFLVAVEGIADALQRIAESEEQK